MRQLNSELDEPLFDDTLDLVSARFADLVARDLQNRQVEDFVGALAACESEEELAQRLLEGLSLRCGSQPMLYVGVDELGLTPTVVSQGYPVIPALPRHSIRSLPADGGDLLDSERVGQLLGSELGAALALRFRSLAGCLALVALQRPPQDCLERDFLQSVVDRVSPLLTSLRLRQSLDLARRSLYRQRQEMQKQARLMSFVDDWTAVLSRLEGRYQQLERILETAVATLGAEKGSLMLLDEPHGELVVRAVCGLDSEIQERIRRGDVSCRRLKLGEGVAGKVAQTHEPLIVNQVDQEPLFLEPHLSQVASIVCLPLQVDGLTLGVMNLTNRAAGRDFLAHQLEEGMKLADQAARAINHSRLYHLAILDPVTELYSRNHLYQRINDELIRARRYQRNLCLLAINLQGLEVVRSHFGHEQGNEIELHFAEILQECVRETDVVARLGDSSFAILMPETDALGGMFGGERICQRSRESELFSRFYITAHVGICSHPDRADTVMRLVARAEQAMSTAARSTDTWPVVLAPVETGESEMASRSLRSA